MSHILTIGNARRTVLNLFSPLRVKIIVEHVIAINAIINIHSYTFDWCIHSENELLQIMTYINSLIDTYIDTNIAARKKSMHGKEVLGNSNTFYKKGLMRGKCPSC